MTVGNLSNDECDEGSENVVKKNELASFQTLSRLLVDPPQLVKCGRFLVELIS